MAVHLLRTVEPPQGRKNRVKGRIKDREKERRKSHYVIGGVFKNGILLWRTKKKKGTQNLRTPPRAENLEGHPPSIRICVSFGRGKVSRKRGGNSWKPSEGGAAGGDTGVMTKQVTWRYFDSSQRNSKSLEGSRREGGGPHRGLLLRNPRVLGNSQRA